MSRDGDVSNAEPKDGDGARPRGTERLQVNPSDAGGREANAVTEQHRQDIHQNLVGEPPPQALTGHVSTEDLQVLAARGAARRVDGFPDVASEERDRGVRRVRRLPMPPGWLSSRPSQ
jgi:hypothetical protein